MVSFLKSAISEYHSYTIKSQEALQQAVELCRVKGQQQYAALAGRPDR